MGVPKLELGHEWQMHTQQIIGSLDINRIRILSSARPFISDYIYTFALPKKPFRLCLSSIWRVVI